ncbi:MAG: ABC transporter transmembrane domain-containing protein [Pyrinomonadaceae bacterium]
MFWIDWQLTLVTLITVPLLFAATTWFRKHARRGYDQVRTRIARLNTFLQENLSGAREVQIFNREAKSLAKFEEINDDHRRANVETVFYYSVFFSSRRLYRCNRHRVNYLVRRLERDGERDFVGRARSFPTVFPAALSTDSRHLG